MPHTDQKVFAHGRDMESVTRRMDGMRRPKHRSPLLLEGDALAVWLELGDEHKACATVTCKKEMSADLIGQPSMAYNATW